MKKILATLCGVLAIVLVAGLLWFFRPWSPYSPALVLEGRNAEDRTAFYRAMTEYYPFREIAGVESPEALPRELGPLEIRYTYDGEERILDDYARDYDVTGLMVVSNGSVIFEEYWRGETAESRHTSWSVAKSFISTLIGIGINEGRIASIDDPVSLYAPEFEGSDYGDVSIRHLLMMSSGIDFVEDYEVVGSDIRRLFFNTFFLNRDIEKFARQFEQERPAGADFDYISTNTVVLGAVVSGAFDGRPLADLVSERISIPLGMANGSWLLDRNSDDGKELAYCCIQLRIEDFARFGLLYLNGGAASGQQIVSEEWTRFVGTPGNEATHAPSTEAGGNNGYGHHFWIASGDSNAYFAAGYNGQIIWIDPDKDVVVVVTSADRDYPGQREIFSMIEAAASAGAYRLPPLIATEGDEL